MKKKLRWFKRLPFGLALRLALLSFFRKLFRVPVQFSFAQGAEDLILSYFPLTGERVYVDVGCNEPVVFSNTFQLYLQGWQGIVIDANKELVKKFKRIRKKDTCICAAVSDIEKEVIFHRSETSAVSTIDEKKIVQYRKQWTFNNEDQEKITTRTLNSILEEHLPPGSTIGLLSIDVEGHDLQVLKGMDLQRYRPRLIIIEVHALDSIHDSEIYKHLSEKEYSLEGFAVWNAYFVDKRIKSLINN
ncbi:MAG TPA: FkbM family methyltransferase [Chitinophagaceae bacterium]|nr:FkbM family methyltransferase [Chitinophagaceae bacterium]